MVPFVLVNLKVTMQFIAIPAKVNLKENPKKRVLREFT